MPERTRKIQKLKPVRCKSRPKESVVRCKRRPPIPVGSTCIQYLCGVVNRKHMPLSTSELIVALRLLVRPHAFCSDRVISVVVILMDGCDNWRNVNDSGAFHARFPDQPVIPPDAANNELRHFRIEAAPKCEVIHRVTRLLDSLPASEGNGVGVPTGRREMEWGGDVRIPAAADHQKFGKIGLNGFKRAAKVARINHVAIAVAENVVASELLCAAKNIVNALCAEFVAFHMRFVAKAQFARNLDGSGIVAEKNNFNVGMEKRPAFEGVALNDFAVASKRFCGGEQRQHIFLF